MDPGVKSEGSAITTTQDGCGSMRTICFDGCRNAKTFMFYVAFLSLLAVLLTALSKKVSI